MTAIKFKNWECSVDNGQIVCRETGSLAPRHPNHVIITGRGKKLKTVNVFGAKTCGRGKKIKPYGKRYRCV